MSLFVTLATLLIWLFWIYMPQTSHSCSELKTPFSIIWDYCSRCQRINTNILLRMNSELKWVYLSCKCLFHSHTGGNHCSLLLFRLLRHWSTISESREGIQRSQIWHVRSCFHPAAVLLLHRLAKGDLTLLYCISGRTLCVIFNI